MNVYVLSVCKLTCDDCFNRESVLSVGRAYASLDGARAAVEEDFREKAEAPGLTFEWVKVGDDIWECEYASEVVARVTERVIRAGIGVGEARFTR